MSAPLKDDVPAFPHLHEARQRINESGYYEGMTLRDWFAAHADQPGTSEAYLLAVEQGEPPMLDGAPHESFSYRVSKWWDGLPLDRRLQLYAACRWRAADAMLAARAGGAK